MDAADIRDHKTMSFLGLRVRPVDALILSSLLLFLALAAGFGGRMEKPLVFIGKRLILAGAYTGSILWLGRLKSPLPRFLVRTVSAQFMFLQIYFMSRDLQPIFFSWNDGLVLAWEKALFGGQPLVWIQKFYTPWLTEVMMFVYVFYVFIYPGLAAVIFFRRGEEAHEDYLLRLGAANLFCGLGFFLFPVAGPLNFGEARALLTAPLDGGFFAGVGEHIRMNVHVPGGTIPSPHSAVATVMWFMAFRYTRRGGWLLAPVILLLYVSTVYGRYHYVSDSIIGILAGILALSIGPGLLRAWNRRAERHGEGRR